jgi:glycosyltransferase involved in cell wall biosynthesis
VLEVYPRLSETFVVTEILAREAQGERVSIFALRPPTDAPAPAAAGRVRAEVHRIPLPSAANDILRSLDDDPTLGERASRHAADLGAAAPADLHQAVLVARAALRAGNTHLHAHFAVTATTVARLASLLSGIPYSFTAHAVDIFADTVSMPDLDRKFRDAAFAVTVSDYNLAYLRERVAHTARTSRLYNGIDLSRYPFVERVPHDGDTRILAVGRLVEKKGFALLIEAVRRLREQGRAVRLDLVGTGELEHDLAAQVAASDHSDSIRLLGALDQDAVAERLREADLFVAPSLVAADGNADALPTVLLEAMASGVPCVSTDLTGIPEIVRNGDTGLLCRPGDVDALTAVLASALEPGFDGAALARRGRAHIERHFDARVQAALLAGLTRGAEVRAAESRPAPDSPRGG